MLSSKIVLMYARSAIPDTQSLQQFTQALKEYIGMIVYRLRGWL
jgi:hypothetical protein